MANFFYILSCFLEQFDQESQAREEKWKNSHPLPGHSSNASSDTRFSKTFFDQESQAQSYLKKSLPIELAAYQVVADRVFLYAHVA